MSRGMLTDNVKQKIEELGIDGTVRALRLMPYLQYTMMNNQKLDINKVEEDERVVLTQLKEQGHIEGGASGLAITKEFWDKMNEILWISYVAQE